jgi:hypothetical protein
MPCWPADSALEPGRKKRCSLETDIRAANKKIASVPISAQAADEFRLAIEIPEITPA